MLRVGAEGRTKVCQLDFGDAPRTRLVIDKYIARFQICPISAFVSLVPISAFSLTCVYQTVCMEGLQCLQDSFGDKLDVRAFESLVVGRIKKVDVKPPQDQGVRGHVRVNFIEKWADVGCYGTDIATGRPARSAAASG